MFGKTQRSTSSEAFARARCAARAQSAPAAEPDEPSSSGWFDSSHALLEGLTVVEHGDLHGNTLELAIEAWLH